MPIRTRWWLNLSLAAMVVALGAVAYFKPHADKPTGPLLTALAAETVVTIRIERPPQDTVTLEKTGTAWSMQAPLHARANPFNIDSLLRVATATSSYQAPVDAETLAKYGLDKPTLRLWLNGDEIAVGITHPMRQQLYVRYRDTVHLIPSYVLTAALHPYTSFLDTQLLEDGRQLVALRLPGLKLSLQDGTWRRETPAHKKDETMSVDRLNEFVAEWQNAHALSVERLSSKPAVAQLELVLEKDGRREPLGLGILAYKPEFILARRDEGLEYHFPEETGKRLLTLTAE